MQRSVQSAYVRLLAIEGVVAVGVNSLLGGIVGWVSFHGVSDVPVAGWAGLTGDAARSGFVPLLLMTPLLTWVIRKRLATGAFAAIEGARHAPFVRALPHNLLVRALVIAIIAGALTAAASSLALSAAGITVLAPHGLIVFKLIQDAIVGLVFAPVVVARALIEKADSITMSTSTIYR